jgi:hypothetical protein
MVQELRLQKASKLMIRVDDPDHLLDPRSSLEDQPPELAMEVPSLSGTKQKAILASTDSAGRTYEIAIPFDTALNFSIRGKRVTLEDERGAAIQAAGADIAIQHRTTDRNPQSLRFVVRGRSQ